MNKTRMNGLIRASLANMAMNTAQRIQQRRTRKGRRRLIRMDLSTLPRRQGGIGARGPIQPRVAVRTVAANVGASLSNLQSQAPVVANGSENLGMMASNPTANIFQVVLNVSLNPAEPGVVPMLAATANQFQRFRTRTLKLTYTPTASTAANGTLYVAVFPDPEADQPKSIEDMTAVGNCKSFPIYGQSNSWVIPPDSIQAAYKVQTIDVKPQVNEDTPLNSSGRLICAVVGAPASTQLGSMTWTYSYELSTKKLTNGSNSLHGLYNIVSPTSAQPLVFDAEDLTAGWEVLVPTGTAGVYRTRCRSAPHLLVVRTTGVATGYEIEVASSPDATTFTNVTPIAARTLTNYTVEAVYHLAATPYVRIRSDAVATLASAHVFCASLRG